MNSSKLCLDFSDAPKMVEHLRVLSARRPAEFVGLFKAMP
jgi:hypothetical protein